MDAKKVMPHGLVLVWTSLFFLVILRTVNCAEINEGLQMASICQFLSYMMWKTQNVFQWVRMASAGKAQTSSPAGLSSEFLSELPEDRREALTLLAASIKMFLLPSRHNNIFCIKHQKTTFDASKWMQLLLFGILNFEQSVSIFGISAWNCKTISELMIRKKYGCSARRQRSVTSGRFLAQCH